MTDEFSYIKSRYPGKCAACGNPWNRDDLIVACNRQYFCRVDCCIDVYPNATKKEQPNTRTSNDGVVTSQSLTTTNDTKGVVGGECRSVSVTARWEIVTGDDGIIVLRRLP